MNHGQTLSAVPFTRRVLTQAQIARDTAYTLALEPICPDRIRAHVLDTIQIAQENGQRVPRLTPRKLSILVWEIGLAIRASRNGAPMPHRKLSILRRKAQAPQRPKNP